MATWDDVRRIALALPETGEHARRGIAMWRVRDKLFVWERPLRPSDLRALGDAAPSGPILGARVEHLIAKEALLADDPDLYFTTPHFDGYPAVLVRLGRARVSGLEELIVEAWLARAPKRLAREYVDAHLPQPPGEQPPGEQPPGEQPPGE
ncbi:MAG: MmcQ/YjbR family DNA-binding protein [Solirubrobacteraceae bacterium]